MNSQTIALTDIQSMEAKYHELVTRIIAAVKGRNEDKRILLETLRAIEKQMARTLSRASRHTPARKYREKYDAFVSSFALTFKLVDQSFHSLAEATDNVPSPLPKIPPTADLKTWQELCEDLVDIAADEERNRTKQERENINRVLDFLDALDRLLDDNTMGEHFLEHLLEMFRVMRIEALNSLRGIRFQKLESPVGKPLDPTYCEVVDTESGNVSDPIVYKQLRAGYLIDGRVFRKAAVIVSKTT